MSRYLARLVARAQPLESSPLSRAPAAAPHDPFESTAPALPASDPLADAPTRSARPTRAAEPTQPVSFSVRPTAAPIEPKVSSAHSPRPAAAVVFPAPASSAFLRPPSSPLPPSPPADATASALPAAASIARAGSPATAVDRPVSSRLRPSVPLPAADAPSSPAGARREAMDTTAPLSPVPLIPNQPAAATVTSSRRESPPVLSQDQLLRQADEFMGRLAARPLQPPSAPLPEPAEASSRAPAVAPPSSVFRLQPNDAVRESAPPPPPAPSVVIGRIHVEVSPPPSAAPAAAPPRSFSRPASSRSRPGVRSSARFGLGQL